MQLYCSNSVRANATRQFYKDLDADAAPPTGTTSTTLKKAPYASLRDAPLVSAEVRGVAERSAWRRKCNDMAL